jgi:NADH-quinone oxidoreductase subunit G
VPAPFHPQLDKLLIVPLYHIFGSDELSILSPAIAELAPKPYLTLRIDDMIKMQLQDGEEIELTLDNSSLHLAAKGLASLPAGTAGLPLVLPGLNGVFPPLWGKVSKIKKAGGTQ